MLMARVVSGGVAAVTCAALVAGCSGGDKSVPDSTPTPTLPGGLTATGANLALNNTATVDFSAGPKRQSKVKVTVTGVQHGRVKDLREFKLDDAARKSGVYYVRASIRNVGHGDLGGAFVKLYAKVNDTLVVQPVIFGSSFGKCNYQPLPKPFGSGKRADVCMVMLAPNHGSVSAVEWRFAGDQADEQPISWELP